MNLALRLSSTEAVVYRKPWGVIAFSIFMAVCLSAAAMGFGFIGYRDINSTIGIPFLIFGSIFGCFSLLMFFDIVRNSGTWLRDDGIPLVIANQSGLVFRTHFNTRPAALGWADINAIVLTDGLETIDSVDTNWTRGQFILFLEPNAISQTIAGRITAHIARSGEGKRYVSTDFQHRSARELEMALRRLAPARLLIRRCKRVIFDHKSHADRYENA